MDSRWIKVRNITYISPLQIDGPIVTPLKVSSKIVRELVRKGYDVIERIDGKDIKLNSSNVDDPLSYVDKLPKKEPPKESIETKAERASHERVFVKNAPISPAPVREEAPKVEESKPVNVPEQPPVEKNYDFGTDVEVENTAIEPVPEVAGRLFTGRSEPDISQELNPIAEVDEGADGVVSDEATAQNPSHSNNNGGNRLQNKRKRRR